MVRAAQAQSGRPAVFLDRDGVLNVPEFRNGRSYAPRRVEEFRLYPQAAESVARLQRAGYAVVVVTNQPDIGAGLMAEGELSAMHDRLRAATGVDAIYVCADRSDAAGPRRKPNPGMLLEAAAELGLDLARSVMVGDRAGDVEAGRRAGCRTVFVDLGYTTEAAPEDQDATAQGIAEAVDWILTPTPPMAQQSAQQAGQHSAQAAQIMSKSKGQHDASIFR